MVKKTNPNLIKNGGTGTAVGNFLRKIATPETLGKVLGVAGGVVTGNYAQIVDIITGSELSEENQRLAIVELDADMTEMREISKRWKSDMISDSFMSKNIRPFTLAFLTLTLTTYIILDSSLEGFSVKNEWVSLLSSLLLLVYGAYFGMRGLEKIQKIRKQ
tara:strand:+ start:1082 stop:1564 length:483 start_codon:yes stop_codon:yes gene_type:complete